jgi:hypothetical protein
MIRPRRFLRLSAPGTHRSKFVMLVGLVVGVMVLAPSALTQLGSLRAAQSETNERSEYETNERMHASANPIRYSKNKGSLLERSSSHSQAADSLSATRRAAAENQLRVPMVVHWSAAMRC